MAAWLRRHWKESVVAAWSGAVLAAWLSLTIEALAEWNARKLLPFTIISLLVWGAGTAGILLFIVLAGRQGRQAPRAWARLGVRDEEGRTRLLQYEVGENTEPRSEEIADKRNAKRVPTRESKNLSVAMSADGSRLASLREQTLRIWTIGLDGATNSRTAPIQIPQTHNDPRVLAVATNGPLADWCVYAFEPAEGPRQVQWVRIDHRAGGTTSTLVGLVGDEAQQRADKGDYSAILGTTLYHLRAADGAISEVHAGCEADPEPPHFGRIEGRVVAIDAAICANRGLVSLLTRDEASNKTKLIVVTPITGRENPPRAELIVKGDPKHVSLLRTFDGEVTMAFVVAAGGKAESYNIAYRDGELLLSPSTPGRPESEISSKTQSTYPGVTG